MKYFAEVNEQEFVIEVDQENRVLVNGEPYTINFHQIPASGLTSLLLNNRSLEAFVEERDEDWQVTLHGELYSVAVQDERARRLAEARGQSASDSGETAIKSPMPGIIIAATVAEGDIIQKGDKVIILESMKMENELKATRDGVVKRVLVDAGVSVEKNQTLVIIGDPDETATTK